MKTIIELITDEIKNVFTECGYDEIGRAHV